jgi:hypothetical protein
MSSGTDTTATTATDQSVDKTKATANPAAATNRPDAIDSLKLALQIGRDTSQTQSATLTNPETAQLFQPTQAPDKARTTDSTPSVLDITPISGRGQVNPSDKQLKSGPWDTINNAFKVDSGPLHFDDTSAPPQVGARELIDKFQKEQQSGQLASDSTWQKYLQSRTETSSPDSSLTAAYEKSHGKSDLTTLLEKSAKGTLTEQQKQQLLQGENDPSWKHLVEQTEASKLNAATDIAAVQKYIDANPAVKDNLKAADAAKQTDVATEHKNLSDWADKTLKEPELSKFKKDMTDFEDRAKRDGLSQDEILKTYQQIERVNAATGAKPLSPLERQHIAQEVMHQAAVPTDISQGFHDTCNVTAVECRTYTRDPAAAAKLVADVALTGEYHAPDGTVVKVDPSAHDQSKTWPPRDGQRTHASEIFEVTAVNIHYAQENAKNGTNIHYEQHDPTPGDNADTGERLMDNSKKPPQEVTQGGFLGWWGSNVRQPDLADKAITDISNSITGKDEKDVLLQAWGKSEGGVTAVHSEAELKAKLKELKDQHKLPVVIFVDTNNEPFYSDSGRGAAGGSGGYHVVTVTDYDENTGQVCVDNQWDKSADHGKGNPINVHDLYTAMQFKEDAEKTLKSDVEYNKAHGIYDPQKEADLIRHQLATNDITPAQAEEQTKQIMQEMSKHWQETNASTEERMSEWKEIEAVIHQLPPDAKMRLAQEAHKDNLITDAWYKEELRSAAFDMVHNHNHASRIFGYNPWADGEYAREQEYLKKAIADLPQADQVNLLNQIAGYVQNNQ